MWKYIVLETDTGQRLPVLFPSDLTHKTVAEEVAGRLRYLDHSDTELARSLQGVVRSDDLQEHRRDWRNAKPISAGFIDGLAVSDAFGFSESLGLKSDASDTVLINTFLHDQGKTPPPPQISSAEAIVAEEHRSSCRRYRTRLTKKPADCSCGKIPT